MHIIITLKDGSEHSLQIFELTECGIHKKTFFLGSRKKGRIEFPIENLRGFRTEASKGRMWEGDQCSILDPAIIILSHFLP